jgi:hypothetical protein
LQHNGDDYEQLYESHVHVDEALGRQDKPPRFLTRLVGQSYI